MDFDWDEGNETHLARHRVSRFEAEQVLADPLGKFLEETIVDEEIRYRVLGSTARGRLLTVAFILRHGRVRPVTAFDAGKTVARKYWQGANDEF